MLNDLNMYSEETVRADEEFRSISAKWRAAKANLDAEAKKEVDAQYEAKIAECSAKRTAAIKSFRQKVAVQQRILEKKNKGTVQRAGGKNDEKKRKSNNDLNGDEKNEDEDENAAFEFEKFGKYQPVKSSRVKETLIGHIIATKTIDSTINDLTMEIPKLDKYGRKDASESEHRGHGDDGTYIAIHSVVVSPKHQGSGIGTLMLTDYIQRMEAVGAGRALILIAVEKNVPFYQSIGFNDDGISECKHADTEWHNLSKSLGEEWETYTD